MAFPRFDISERNDGKFVLARIEREADLEPDDCESPGEIVGVFDTEMDARIQLLRIVASPTLRRPQLIAKAANF